MSRIQIECSRDKSHNLVFYTDGESVSPAGVGTHRMLGYLRQYPVSDFKRCCGCRQLRDLTVSEALVQAADNGGSRFSIDFHKE